LQGIPDGVKGSPLRLAHFADLLPAGIGDHVGLLVGIQLSQAMDAAGADTLDVADGVIGPMGDSPGTLRRDALGSFIFTVGQQIFDPLHASGGRLLVMAHSPVGQPRDRIDTAVLDGLRIGPGALRQGHGRQRKGQRSSHERQYSVACHVEAP